MAYYDEPLVDPTLDFDAQQQVLTQQAARIKALRERYGKPYTPDNAEVGGFTLSTGQRIPGRIVGGGLSALAQGVAPLLAEYTATGREGNMAREQSALNKRQQEDAVEWGRTIPRDTPYRADPTNAPSATNPNGNFVEANVTPAAKADRGEVLTAALRGYKNPLTRATAQQYLADQLIKEPEREEARAERLSREEAARAAAIAAAALKAREDLEWKRENARNQKELANIKKGDGSGDGGLDHNMTYMGPDPKDPTKGLWADPRNPAKPPVQGALDMKKPEGELKNMPTGEQAKYSANKASLVTLNEILGDDANRGATGLVKGAIIKGLPLFGIGTKIANAMGTKGQEDRRAAIARLSAIEVHRLYGSALTLGEIARSGGFMPEVTDDDDQVAAKLGKMREFIDRENRAIEDMARAQGYRPPTLPGADAPPGPPTATPPPGNQPPSASPVGVGPNGLTSLQANQEAFNRAKADYELRKTATNQRKMDLAYADLVRSQTAERAAAEPAKVLSTEDRLAKYGIGGKK